MQIILFEDKQIDKLYPITLTRAGFEISCGGISLYDLVKRYFRTQKVSYMVRDYLAGAVKERCPVQKLKGSDFLFINASVVPSINNMKELEKKLLKPGVVLENNGRIVGARVLGRVLGGTMEEIFSELGGKVKKTKVMMFDNLWDIITRNLEILGDNINYLGGGKREVYVGKGVVADKNVVLDASEGPIYIGDETEIFPFVNIRGPVYIGKKCKIKTFADIKEGTVIRDICKIGGEVEASVVEMYSNKQHVGFLGHAYVGSWVNIGGGTMNSDLKNTYGTIKMQIGSAKIDTGLQFLGCVIGDYSKTGINTSILTGKIIGINSNVIGMVSKNVPSFTNLTPLGMTEYYLEQAIKVQKRVFTRRDVKQTPADRKMMEAVFEMTREERKSAGVKKGKIRI
ncbi:hypothetical protein HQ544_03210 [Candidatus Falkowbacteria bacterium]|nr:hypothetical protein [Candidatus Falkowbacteria bacterium]